MSELKATKGPWFVDMSGRRKYPAIRSLDGQYVMECIAGKSHAWLQSDAHLIAAAPELYDELEQLKAALRVTIDEYKAVMRPAWVAGMENDIASAEKLLAKARGEA